MDQVYQEVSLRKQDWGPVLGCFHFLISSMSICFLVGLTGVLILSCFVAGLIWFLGGLYVLAYVLE